MTPGEQAQSQILGLLLIGGKNTECICDQVAVGEHDAFWFTRGSRGIENGCYLLPAHLLSAGSHFGHLGGTQRGDELAVEVNVFIGGRMRKGVEKYPASLLGKINHQGQQIFILIGRI